MGTIKCTLCGDIITSAHTHDFVRCSCGNAFIDGGDEYIRVGTKEDNSVLFYKDGEFVPFPVEG